MDGAIDGLFSDEVRDIVILTCKTENDSILTPHLVNGGYPAGKKFIRFTTCRKFKGLEADAVILVDVDKTTFTGNDGQNVLLYYVGTSRARLRLDVIAQLDDSDCLAVLEALGKAQNLAVENGNPELSSAHLLSALLAGRPCSGGRGQKATA